MIDTETYWLGLRLVHDTGMAYRDSRGDSSNDVLADSASQHLQHFHSNKCEGRRPNGEVVHGSL